MGAGKSTVGEALARRLGWVHVDTDAVLAARHGPVADQVRHDPAAFRAREQALAGELAAGRSQVVSTGGGWVEAGDALERLLATHLVVFLDAPLAVLAERVRGTDRPLWDPAVAERWARRRPRWELAHARVDAEPPAEVVVERVARAAAPADLLHLGPDGPCPVRVARDPAELVALVDAVAPSRRLLITDEHVAARWGEAAAGWFRAGSPLVLRAGEEHKTVAAWAAAVDAILQQRPTRDTTVLALGGGVVGDLAGFAAATALRGLPVVQLPTTLLAMVDSSLGGKTAVDHPLGKNLVGAFHPPVAVGAWPGFLATLPPRELASGYAEVVKTALVGDPGLLALAGELPLEDVVRRCLAVKSALVARDPWDRGVRAWLNAGHTVGHAVERVAGYGAWTHGEAVSVGLVAEARWAVRAGVCLDPTLPDRLARARCPPGGSPRRSRRCPSPRCAPRRRWTRRGARIQYGCRCPCGRGR
jgi:shikimate kinase/3-dehydroquinate synthase